VKTKYERLLVIKLNSKMYVLLAKYSLHYIFFVLSDINSCRFKTCNQSRPSSMHSVSVDPNNASPQDIAPAQCLGAAVSARFDVSVV